MSEEIAAKDALRARIEAAEARNGRRSVSDYAASARDGASDFVRDHPLTTVAGGVAIGLVVGSLIPGRRIGRRAGALATTFGELGAAYAAGLINQAEDLTRNGKDRAEDLAGSLTDQSRKARRDANLLAATASDAAKSLSRRAGQKASRALRDAKRRATH